MFTSASELRGFVFLVRAHILAGSTELITYKDVVDQNSGAVGPLLMKLLNLVGFECRRTHAQGEIETGRNGRARTMQWCCTRALIC